MAQDPSAPWRARKEQWHRYVEEVVRAVERGVNLPTGPSTTPLVAPPATGSAPPIKVLFCAPHPDDESLSSALPLRLRLEGGARVTNVAITLGSDVERRAQRLVEVESACRVLGFGLVVPHHPQGFENVNPRARRTDPNGWALKVNDLQEIFERQEPDVVFAPHADDLNTTHIGTHLLVKEALGAHLERRGLGTGAVPLIETEFWHQLAQPNLMVGVSAEVVAIQLMAAAEHGGEMVRSPYHLRHACRLMDGVRRGSEVVGGQGVAAQTFTFAELYHFTFLKGRQIVSPRPVGCIVGPTERIDLAWLVSQFGPAQA